MNIRTDDEYLNKRIDTFDKWMREGKIPYSSKIIPIKQSRMLWPTAIAGKDTDVVTILQKCAFTSMMSRIRKQQMALLVLLPSKKLKKSYYLQMNMDSYI